MSTALGQILAKTPDPSTDIEHMRGTVESFTTDAPATITALLNGADTPTEGIRYFPGYTPTNGDTIEVLRVDSDYLALGALRP